MLPPTQGRVESRVRDERSAMAGSARKPAESQHTATPHFQLASLALAI
jgi:hypothetical protein